MKELYRPIEKPRLPKTVRIPEVLKKHCKRDGKKGKI
jgi:hypothetical protein